jgi:DNA replication protein DnaC
VSATHAISPVAPELPPSVPAKRSTNSIGTIQRAVDRALLEQLLRLDFLGRGENVLFRGQAGVGKTTLAQNLGLRALERGHTVRFSTLPAALADLLRQASLPATERRLRRYTSPDLLILDELGYVPCDHQSCLQAVGLRLPRRFLPRRSGRSLRAALPPPRHRRRVLAP